MVVASVIFRRRLLSLIMRHLLNEWTRVHPNGGSISGSDGRIIILVQLILHIGTHKTGTSALQECLRRNEQVLAGRGIHYARIAPYKNCNGIAKMVAKTRGPEVKDFFDRHVNKAITLGANTLVISAESLYAMTIFFHKFNGRNARDYWNSEHEAIEFLHHAITPEVNTRIIVFFRRQDYFLESIYREVVKSRDVAMPIHEFRSFFGEALNYWRHMQLWSAVFPDCAVFTYEQASNNISEFFFRNVLNITNIEAFGGLNARMNLRLSRDVLEYKRMLNGMVMSDVDRYMSNLVCTELAQTLMDDGLYQDYLTPNARVALLQEMESDNALLCKKFGMKPLPAVSDDDCKDWAPYPGLSAERVKELAERHARIRRRVGYQIERSALLLRQFIFKCLPRLAWIIPLGRLLLPRHRHQW
jgi:hypothetical protein